MTSLRERKSFIQQLNVDACPFKMEIEDRGDSLKIRFERRYKQSAVDFWSTLLQEVCEIDGYCDINSHEYRPSSDVFIKIEPSHGQMKIKGDDHWQWFVENFERLINLHCGNDAGYFDENMSMVSDLNLSTFDHRQTRATWRSGMSRGTTLGKKTIDAKTICIDIIDKNGMTLNGLLCQVPDCGCLQAGITFVYPLWKALIGHWIGLGADLIIASHLLDAERLADILTWMIVQKSTIYRGTVTIYVPQRCDEGVKWSNVCETAQRLLFVQKKRKKYLSNEDIVWSLRAIQVRHARQINFNFISAQTSPVDSEILVTSASFHKKHFLTPAMSSVWFKRLSSEQFRTHYVASLHAESLQTSL